MKSGKENSFIIHKFLFLYSHHSSLPLGSNGYIDGVSSSVGIAKPYFLSLFLCECSVYIFQ